jgi:hypothetical protein
MRNLSSSQHGTKQRLELLLALVVHYKGKRHTEPYQVLVTLGPLILF